MTVAIAAALLLGAVGPVAAAEPGTRYVVAVSGMHYTGMYALKMTPAAEPVATGISLPPATLGQWVFIVSAVVLVLLLAFSAWKSQRAVMADL